MSLIILFIYLFTAGTSLASYSGRIPLCGHQRMSRPNVLDGRGEKDPNSKEIAARIFVRRETSPALRAKDRANSSVLFWMLLRVNEQIIMIIDD